MLALNITSCLSSFASVFIRNTRDHLLNGNGTGKCQVTNNILAAAERLC